MKYGVWCDLTEAWEVEDLPTAQAAKDAAFRAGGRKAGMYPAGVGGRFAPVSLASAKKIEEEERREKERAASRAAMLASFGAASPPAQPADQAAAAMADIAQRAAEARTYFAELAKNGNSPDQLLAKSIFGGGE